MIVWVVAAVIILLVLLIIVYLFDVNYFLRVATVYLSALFRRRRLDFLDESVLYGRVLPFDSDIQLLHMNNARVLREWDFGRLDLWTRVGLLDDHLKNLKSLSMGPVYAVANVVRYRRPMHMFKKYKIVTRTAYWEGKIIYHEHKLVTVNDNITRNLGYCKVIFPFDLDDFVKRRYPHVVKPVPSKDLDLWMKYNDANTMDTKILSDVVSSEDEGSDQSWESSLNKN